MPARSIKITYRKESIDAGQPQKAQTADNQSSVVSGDVSNKHIKISSKQYRTTKRNKKTGNGRNVAISMVRRWCECEWYEAVTIPCWSERVIQTALGFHLYRGSQNIRPCFQMSKQHLGTTLWPSRRSQTVMVTSQRGSQHGV